jgi:hypothetical protein
VPEVFLQKIAREKIKMQPLPADELVYHVEHILVAHLRGRNYRLTFLHGHWKSAARMAPRTA